MQALRLSSEGLSQTTTGQIVNLMSNDVNRFDQVGAFNTGIENFNIMHI